jgi:lysylphosphatidylglycerol synthetase-like protein (DUF2156 family)
MSRRDLDGMASAGVNQTSHDWPPQPDVVDSVPKLQNKNVVVETLTIVLTALLAYSVMSAAFGVAILLILSKIGCDVTVMLFGIVQSDFWRIVTNGAVFGVSLVGLNITFFDLLLNLYEYRLEMHSILRMCLWIAIITFVLIICGAFGEAVYAFMFPLHYPIAGPNMTHIQRFQVSITAGSYQFFLIAPPIAAVLHKLQRTKKVKKSRGPSIL